LLEKVDRNQLSAGTFTLNDILEELRNRGAIRATSSSRPAFNEGSRNRRCAAGMVLEGVVTNVTKFGAFVDIGVHQDGLVHISELSNRFIKEPSDAVKAGPDREGEGAERRCQDQAHRALHQALNSFWVLVIFGFLSQADSRFDLPGRTVILTFAAWFVGQMAAGVWLNRFRCPRCENLFYWKWGWKIEKTKGWRRCRHCGLSQDSAPA
jgi:hypothetical protein